ncbi:hypothetical protein RhoFasK5_03532|nr:hypothetical protein [Rhodococcus kroppenstedtii]
MTEGANGAPLMSPNVLSVLTLLLPVSARAVDSRRTIDVMTSGLNRYVEVAERRRDVDDDTMVPREAAEELLDKHMTRWGTLLERLK